MTDPEQQELIDLREVARENIALTRKVTDLQNQIVFLCRLLKECIGDIKGDKRSKITEEFRLFNSFRR
jgi:hypothetical protein|tara:strand:+ start:236 stop:439 length:204 start_codon:yes stop_codon:yes gene_type:complete